MELIVEAETPDRSEVSGCKGGQEGLDVGHLGCHLVLPKDVGLDNPGLGCLADVVHAVGENCISVVGGAVRVLGHEPDESLEVEGW